MQNNKKIIGIFDNLTIKIKLILLSGLLLVALVATNLYGYVTTSSLQHSMEEMRTHIKTIEEQATTAQQVLGKQQSALNRLEVAQNTLRTFGEFKYWLTDLSASWLNEAESNADAAKEKLGKQLKQMATFAPKQAKSVGAHAEKIYEVAISAVDAYAGGNRVKGNSLLAEVRRNITKVDAILIEIVQAQTAHAEDAKEQVLDATDETISNAQGVIAETGTTISQAKDSISQSAGVTVVALIVAVLATLLVIRSLIGPINRIVGSMRELADGNTQIEVPAATHNEIGRLAGALQVFKDSALEKIQLEEEQKKAEIQAEADKKEAMQNLAGSFEERVQGIIDHVATSATQLTGTAEQMTTIVDASSVTVQNASDGAAEVSANVQSVAAAAEELTATVQEISSSIHRSNDMVSGSVKAVEEADTHAAALSESSKKVQEVIGLISDISSQINLLALNATIESARAGEAGKGFAVVASEVKNLANQTDKSIQEIDKVISEMDLASNNIIDSLGGIKESIGNISESSNSVAASVEEQLATTNEIAKNMQTAAAGTQAITNNLEDVSSSSAQANSSSQEVLSASQELSKQAGQLDQEVKGFLSEIRTA